MGVISRKIFPACESMCICCPALRSRSRQPVKRYKKLLADIFPKSADGSSSDRKIVKLCEYAAKNPFRIPKIVKYLEERCYKELRSEHVKFINIIMDVYYKLLCICKEQMAYFAVSLLGVVKELIDNGQQDALQILGCQTLTKFIYSQTDTTYTHNIEKYVRKVCTLARESGEGDERRCLRASTLQCLSAMVWFMAEYSYIFVGFDEIVHVTLDNYDPEIYADHDDDRGVMHHNWVDEVVRTEGRVGGDGSPNCFVTRQRPEKKDPSLLMREEMEAPKVWAHICLQRMADLAKESTTTMRRVLDPMFVYFDSGRHWARRQGLAFVVLSDMTFMVENSVSQQSVLAAVIRHLDHKNVSHDPRLKSSVVKVATALVRQIRLRTVLAEIGFVSDLCRHLRKSLQATVESVGDQELNLNTSLQNTIEDCLLEIAKGVGEAQPLLDMMAITLEKLPSAGIVARATIGSSMVLAHMISLVSISSQKQQVFPEELLVQILRAMLHPDPEVRVGAHQMFSILLIPNSARPRHEISYLRANCLYEPRRWQSSTASALASVTVRLEKLRKEKNGIIIPEKHLVNIQDDFKGIDSPSDDRKQGCVCKNSPNFYKISEAEPYVLKFSEDQISQLLSAFWLQANLHDNLPSNYEAIAHSYVLTLLSSRLMNPSSNLVICIFQLPIAMKKTCLDPNTGTLPASRCRSIFTLSVSMLMFAAKIYHIFSLIDQLKSFDPQDVDPYLGITEDFQVFVRPQVDSREYGSVMDNQLASLLLDRLRKKVNESEKVLLDTLVRNLSSITELDEVDVRKQLSESFTPDDAFMFGPQLVLDLGQSQIRSHSKNSSSFDEEFPSNSSVEDDAASEASVDLSHFVPRMTSPSLSHVISIGQLLESALVVAGQVAGTSLSSSPLPYNAMTSQCEALGAGPRKKLSNWLAQENHSTGDACVPIEMTSEPLPIQGPMGPLDRSLTMKLPPASPFDNFLKAAGC
ncbi:protein SEMI-ROLLED LEAF 2 isoform X2 [Punica granatum]|uniref:Protein SEMI-ROLLED LEAF 2 isoform X2 n=1 Tax=Punica granatum TaxID=22663 RepID=A0A6P8CM28_PUNGR|nr:protein SEMI-ROLLED LEAF 2 isoform X2 [Punica granatum]